MFLAVPLAESLVYMSNLESESNSSSLGQATRHAVPSHLETYLHAYIDGAGPAGDPKALLFRNYNRPTCQLTCNLLSQPNAYAMIRRRALAAEITTKIGNHTFRATDVTAYLKNGGTLEKAEQMANHASTRTTRRSFTTAAPRK